MQDDRETLCNDAGCGWSIPHVMGVEGCRWHTEEVRYQDLSPNAGAIGKGTGLINCLDHGFVRLVDWMGGDISISRAARVSYDAAWRAGEDEGSDAKLINYLWKNSHTSPFEAVLLTFEVKAPIFIFRQWHRHRTWSYNELSARYRELPEEFYLPDPALVGEQAKDNKQARLMILSEDADNSRQRGYEVRDVGTHCEAAFQLYRELLGKGWPRELARSVLPVNTYSHMFATVNLLNLFRFLTLRDDAHAQYEIQVYAKAMRELAKIVAPVAVAAWEKHRKPDEATIGVGNGSGNLFVHGSYESVKRVQEMVFELERLRGRDNAKDDSC